MNECDPKLLEGLRGLAADGPQEAPAFVEEKLLSEFRRSRARRRNLKVLVATGAIAAGIAAMLFIRPAPTVQPTQKAEVTEMNIQDDEGFYRLPDADELPPVETAMVVRVELPRSSLRLMGVPISDDRADEAVEADLLLAQDGLARGVRLVE